MRASCRTSSTLNNQRVSFCGEHEFVQADDLRRSERQVKILEDFGEVETEGCVSNWTLKYTITLTRRDD